MKLILSKCIVLALFVGILSAVKFRCDYAYSDVGWLKYHEVPATWRDARLRCRFEGGMLASPTTPELKDAMMTAIRDVDIFTGIHATFSPGSYYTIDGVSLASIPHTWAENEPDNKNNAENCITLNSDGDLSDLRCDTPRPYMCFRAKSASGANICGTTDPEYQFETRTNKCYKFHTTRRTFARAHFVCSAEGGHLAIINSEVESQVLRDIFARYPANKLIGNFWKETAFIGFQNWGESADWVTIDGQTLKEAGYDKFCPGQPDNFTTGEYCGSVLRPGCLNDLHCEGHYPFICEKEPGSPAVCNSEDFNENNYIELN